MKTLRIGGKMNMWVDEFYAGFEKIKQSLLDSKCGSLQAAIARLKSQCEESDFETNITFGTRFLIMQLLNGDIDENVDEEIWAAQVFDNMAQYIVDSKKPLYFKVCLDSYGSKVYRKICVPSTQNLSHLAYLIMLSFGAFGDHLYTFHIGNRTYYGELFTDVAEDNFADQHLLAEFDWTRVRKMKMMYDMGDSWTFTITPLKKGKDNLDEYPLGYIFEGKGPDIWEDNHNLYDMYMDDPKTKIGDYIGYDDDLTVEELAKEDGEMEPFDLKEYSFTQKDFAELYHARMSFDE